MPPNKRRRPNTRALLAVLEDLVDTLPTADERLEASRNIEIVIGYLQEVQERLNKLPLPDDLSSARGALSQFDDLVESAERNPVLAMAFGTKPFPKRTSRDPDKLPEAQAREILRDWEHLSIDQLRERLQTDKTLTLRDLRGVASIAGLRISAKNTRATLINQLITWFANQRGYRLLGGAWDPIATSPQTEEAATDATKDDH
jgi:hypothetical protein